MAIMADSTALLDRDDTEAGSFAQEWRQWHDGHEQRRAEAHGFLSITGLFWLGAEPQRLRGVPGLWSSDEEGPVVELAEGESIEVDGRTVTGRHAFGPLPERGGVDASSGQVRIEIARRGGNDIVRPRDPAHPFRAAYEGTPAYPAEQGWRIQGRYTPFEAPQPVTVGSAVEGLQHVYEAPGAVEFDIDGQPQRLIAFNGHRPGTLNLLFTDATSGVTTYAANRSLTVEAPDAEGRVTIDFNRATNLPCAYTDFATCPLPPADNHLQIAIEAGEQTPLARYGEDAQA